MVDGRNVLAIDTASQTPAVALLARGDSWEEPLAPDRRASEELLPAIRRCLDRAGLTLRDLSRIAVCAGPGSFTGVRVGLATAWGLGRAAGVSVETVSTLEAIAETARSSGEPRVWAALDAGRGDLVLQRFQMDRGRAESREVATLVPASAATAHAGGDPLIGGSIANPSLASPPTPARALAEAAARWPGEPATGSLQAIYTRPSAAEEKHGAA